LPDKHKEEAMFLEPFTCGAELPDGRRCDEAARITDAEYIYREEFIEGRFQQILDEIHYTLECPKCGEWKRIETVHMNKTSAHV
jgi:hypothetical protein